MAQICSSTKTANPHENCKARERVRGRGLEHKRPTIRNTNGQNAGSPHKHLGDIHWCEPLGIFITITKGLLGQRDGLQAITAQDS